jgi:hypothetical protein
VCPLCEVRVRIHQFLRVREDGLFQHVECPPLGPAGGDGDGD